MTNEETQIQKMTKMITLVTALATALALALVLIANCQEKIRLKLSVGMEK